MLAGAHLKVYDVIGHSLQRLGWTGLCHRSVYATLQKQNFLDHSVSLFFAVSHRDTDLTCWRVQRWLMTLVGHPSKSKRRCNVRTFSLAGWLVQAKLLPKLDGIQGANDAALAEVLPTRILQNRGLPQKCVSFDFFPYNISCTVTHVILWTQYST